MKWSRAYGIVWLDPRSCRACVANDLPLELNERDARRPYCDGYLACGCISMMHTASNNIGEKGMAALAGTLGHNIVIKSLDLEENPATGVCLSLIHI